MDNQLYTGFVGNRSDFLQEVNQVGTQFFRCDVFVAVEFLLELLQCEALFRTGQSGNHVADEQLLVGIRHLLKTSFGLGLLFVGVVVFGTGTLQQEEVEGDESGTFETQGAAAVGQFVSEVGTRPVQYRHEVVGYDVHATLTEITQAFFIIIDVFLEISCLSLDMLVYRHTFYY